MSCTVTFLQLERYTRRGRIASRLVHCGLYCLLIQNSSQYSAPFPSIQLFCVVNPVVLGALSAEASTAPRPVMVNPSSPSALISAAKYFIDCPSMRDGSRRKSLILSEPFSLPSTSRFVPCLKNSEPVRNVPSGTTTSPPPSSAQRSMTLCISAVCSTVESFFTP